MNYIINLGDGGKRIRPAIVMTIVDVFNGDKKTGQIFAEAVELIHSYTLIIDDIQDDGKTRRGEATCHIKYDTNTAILAATRLFERGAAPFHNYCPYKFQILNDQLHQGQAADLNTKDWSKDQLTLQDLQFIHAGKTSSLIQMSILGGCVASGLNDEHTEKLLRYGYYLGLAFQAKDDILSRVSKIEETGKSSMENKTSFTHFFEDPAAALNAAKELARKAKTELSYFSKNNIGILEEITDFAVLRNK